MSARGALVVGAAMLGLATPPATALAFPVEPLGHAGRWITDASGRVVVIHGVSVVPANERQPPASLGFGDDDARFIAAQGFNGVRLGLFYAGLEPRLGSFADAYLRTYERTYAQLARAGVFSLIDFHQDQLAERYAGRGYPGWFAIDGGLPNNHQPFALGYLTNPALNGAYDSLWANAKAADGVGLQDHLAAGWRRVAGRFVGRARVLGYDVFNEPWPGSVWPTCANPLGCPPGGFDQTLLTRFFDRIVATIRKVDARHLAFYEPNLQFDVGAATGLGKLRDPDVGLSFHDYCLGTAPGLPEVPPSLQGLCGIGEQLVMTNAENHSARTGAALLLTEFGDDENFEIHRRVTDLADANMVGWTEWAYLAGVGNLIKDTHQPPTPDNLRMETLRALVRPYPQVVAGTPQSYGFNRASRVFELAYSTTLPSGRPAPGLNTEVFVPPLQYAAGYAAGVAGAGIVSKPGACVLRLRALPGARRVTLRVTPAKLEGGIRCVPARLSLTARRVRGRLRVGWSARGGDLATWGFDVAVNGRRVLRQTARRSLSVRRPVVVRVRAVDAAGNRGPWAALRG